MREWFAEHLGRRPWWMNLMFFFCVYMAVVYVPWDLFVKPAAFDEEVWFGVRFHGAAAKWLAIPHWFVYAAGAVGFWRMRSWMHPWAAVYAAQVAISMLIWPMLYRDGFSAVVLGLVAGAAFTVPVVALWNAREAFQGPGRSLRERYGEWALVTGASAGIGAAFARACARDGMGVVLVARREDRLRALADEIEKRHSVAARVVPADLASPDACARIAAATEDLEIGLLVNNAGFGYAGRFDRQDPARLQEMVQVNCAAPVALTAHYLPGMRSRGRGAVIFTGSVAGSQPLPFHALYSATKAFDNLLAEALWAEQRGTGVDVLVLEPGSTESEFQEVAGEIPHHGQTADEVVAVALGALGHQPSVISGFGNWLRANLAFRLLPRSVLSTAAGDYIARQTPPDRL